MMNYYRMYVWKSRRQQAFEKFLDRAGLVAFALAVFVTLMFILQEMSVLATQHTTIYTIAVKMDEEKTVTYYRQAPGETRLVELTSGMNLFSGEGVDFPSASEIAKLAKPGKMVYLHATATDVIRSDLAETESWANWLHLSVAGLTTNMLVAIGNVFRCSLLQAQTVILLEMILMLLALVLYTRYRLKKLNDE